MAQKFNTEFNYRYQVIGNTPWEKIKTLKSDLTTLALIDPVR